MELEIIFHIKGFPFDAVSYTVAKILLCRLRNQTNASESEFLKKINGIVFHRNNNAKCSLRVRDVCQLKYYMINCLSVLQNQC